MNILITSIIDLEKTTYSRLHHFIEHLVSKGHKVTVISIRDSWKKTDARQNQALLKKIRVRYITEKEIGPIMQKGSAIFRMKRILKGIDISRIDVHLSYNSLFLSYMIAKKLKKLNIKTVYDLADDLPDMIRTSPHLPAVLKPIAGIIGKHLLEQNLKLADMITITASEFNRSLGISRFHHRLLPNGVDIKRFKPKKSKHKGIVIGYLGALREWVDLRPMLTAVKNLKGYRLSVLIVGGEEELEQYKDFVKENKMTDIVKFTGNVPYQKVPNYVNTMDIATVPFKKNRVTDGTCPLKLLEYMAMEKPVICSKLNEVKHMVGDKVLYANTAKEWEKQISLLYHDEIMRWNLGSQGRKFVEDNYNWKHICNRMEQTLKEHSRR
ncbi:glycosyltransferase family 4 protein [Candidatus Woesearchaeota archaeon]|nr:glycosyltransferase family 4 protein [Candidatus Woesearchaeota archaeon]